MTLDPYISSIIWLSLKVAAASLAIAAVIGIPLGVALGLTRFSGRLVFLILVNAAIGLPPVVAGLVTFLLLRKEGVLGGLQLLYTPTAMILAQIPLIVPLIAGITMAGITAVPAELRLQARALGATRIREAITVLREAKGTSIAAIIAGFGASVSEVGAILITGGNLLVGGENYTRTMTTAIVLETRLGNYQRALTFGGILLGIILVVNVFLTRAQVGKRSE
jgi:tungstate transport system permease protein